MENGKSLLQAEGPHQQKTLRADLTVVCLDLYQSWVRKHMKPHESAGNGKVITSLAQSCSLDINT